MNELSLSTFTFPKIYFIFYEVFMSMDFKEIAWFNLAGKVNNSYKMWQIFM